VEFDITFTTASGNLQQRAINGSNAAPYDYLADSGDDGNWFAGPLTITVNNFTGADPADINFRLLGVSGQRLVTNDVNFASTATPVTTKSLGTAGSWGSLFTDLPLDSTAANMAGGSYTATLTWVNIDVESWGLYKDISFEVSVNSGGPVNPYTTWASTNAPSPQTPDDDFDGDGVSNAVEFVLGGDKDTNDLDKLPSVGTSGGNMTFSFVRDQSSIAATTVVTIEVSTDLVTWDTAPSPYAVPDTASVGPPVAVVDNADGTDTVTLTVAQAPDAKKFARLKVAITP
jgi:hypothetical protein